MLIQSVISFFPYFIILYNTPPAGGLIFLDLFLDFLGAFPIKLGLTQDLHNIIYYDFFPNFIIFGQLGVKDSP